MKSYIYFTHFFHTLYSQLKIDSDAFEAGIKTTVKALDDTLESAPRIDQLIATRATVLATPLNYSALSTSITRPVNELVPPKMTLPLIGVPLIGVETKELRCLSSCSGLDLMALDPLASSFDETAATAGQTRKAATTPALSSLIINNFGPNFPLHMYSDVADSRYGKNIGSPNQQQSLTLNCLLSSPCSSGFAARFAVEPANQHFGGNVQVRDQTTVGSTLETLHSQQKSSLLVSVTSASNSVVSIKLLLCICHFSICHYSVCLISSVYLSLYIFSFPCVTLLEE